MCIFIAYSVVTKERIFRPMNSQFRIFNPRMLLVMGIMLAAALVVTSTASSCSSEAVGVPVDRIVEKEVVKVVEKEVPVEVIKEVTMPDRSIAGILIYYNAEGNRFKEIAIAKKANCFCNNK